MVLPPGARLHRKIAVSPLEVAWRRIQLWCERHAPAALDALNPPVIPEDLAELEAELGSAVPADYRRFLAMHDGDDDGGPLPVQLLSVAESVQTRRRLCRSARSKAAECSTQGRVRQVWYASGWVPVTRDGGHYHCIDLAPGPAGRVGQVVSWRPDRLEQRVIAESFTHLLERYASALEQGDCVAVEFDGTFVRVMREHAVREALGAPSDARDGRDVVTQLMMRGRVCIEASSLPCAVRAVGRALEDLPADTSCEQAARSVHHALSEVRGVRVRVRPEQLLVEISH